MQYSSMTTILENIAEAYFSLDRNGCFTYVNSMAEGLLGRDRQELMGKELFAVLHGGKTAPVFLRCQEAVSIGKPVEFMAELHGDPMRISGRAVPGPQGLHVFFQSIRPEEHGQQINEMALLATLELAPFGIALLDTDLRFIQANRLFAESLHKAPEELRGSRLPEVVAAAADIAHAAQLAVLLTKTLETGETMTTNALLSPPSGQSYSDLLIKRLEANGVTAGLLLTTTNISDTKPMEREMMRLDQLNLVGQMAAAISHEVRNPLTTVRGFLQVMNRKDDCRHYREYIELMISELDRANSIISEFLSVAKTNSAYYTETDLNSIILTIEPLLATEAVAKGYTLTLELGKIKPLCLNEKEIRQLLLNLVRNGFEAMPQRGMVTVRTYEEINQVVLAIKDEGTGIAPQILSRLGTPFLTSKANGTGLGLAVCYGIVERHKGRIEVATGTEGTTFYIRFSR